MALTTLLNHLTIDQRAVFLSLKTPYLIQNFLDELSYVGEELNRSPLRVIQDRQCHCLDGGMLGAAALWNIGYPPLLVDLIPEPGTDDDHVLAIFKQGGKYGAVAKSNFSGLRFREPVYKTLRELVMSYFESFYNVEGKKTMRGYTRPLNLRPYHQYDWLTNQKGVDLVVDRLYKLKSIPIISSIDIAKLNPVDSRSYQAGMLGVNVDGLYKPGKSSH